MEQLSLPQIRYDEITYAIMHESEDYASKMYLEDYLRELYYSRNDLEAIYLYVVKENKYYSISQENYNITVRIGHGSWLSANCRGTRKRWQAPSTAPISPL